MLFDLNVSIRYYNNTFERQKMLLEQFLFVELAMGKGIYFGKMGGLPPNPTQLMIAYPRKGHHRIETSPRRSIRHMKDAESDKF